MDFKELEKKSEKDLVKLLTDFREKAQALRFKVAASEVKNHQELKSVKRDIARVLTLINQRKLEHDGE